MKIRVGLVGLGEAWQNCHRPALRSLHDRFEVRAICTNVALLGERAAREFGAETVDGFRALASRPDVDAVVMLSPEWYGSLPLLAACDSGKAIYCAAPLDIDLDSAREVKQRVEDSGVAFMAEFPRRNMAATLRLKELIATRLGQPRLLFCHARGTRRTVSNGAAHLANYPADTRELMELTDWCRYVVGAEPMAVTGVQHLTENRRDNDYHMISLDFSPEDAGTGTLAHISCGRYLPAGWPEAASFRPPAELQVCCERGVAFLDLPSTLTWFDEAGRHLESLDHDMPVGEQLLTQFHRAVTSLIRKTTDLEDAYRALHVVLRAQQSAREGRRLPIEFG